MLVVYVPSWALDRQEYAIPVTLGNGVPNADLLKVTGCGLAESAVLSGRPSRFLLNPNSLFNGYYAQWRVDSCFNGLELDSSSGFLQRSQTFFDEVDPTEKGYLNYILAGALTKYYLSSVCGVTWLAHLSLAKQRLYVGRAGKSRKEPDYIGSDQTNYVLAEAKGRIKLYANTKRALDNKDQFVDIKRVNGQTNFPHKYGVAVSCKNGKDSHLCLYATDPDVQLDMPLSPRLWVKHYYEFVESICGVGDAPRPNITERIDRSQSFVPVSISLPKIVWEWAEELEDDRPKNDKDFAQLHKKKEELREELIENYHNNVTISPELLVIDRFD